ncbi:MAG: T9SS type A sorting domain-containing protein [Saprospiraceae bacterium]
MKNQLILSCILFSILNPLAAQHFVYQSDAPFGIQPARTDGSKKAQTIKFYDFDGDGDYDIMLTGLDYTDNVPQLQWKNLHFFVDVQINTGTPYAPQFSARDSFMHFPFPVGYFFMSPGDLNADGLQDFITTADIDFIGHEKVTMQINAGWPTMGPFNATSLDVMGLPAFVPESFFMPELVDLDRDGDLDLMMSGFESAFAVEDGPDIPTFYYARNMGTNLAPAFEGWYPSPYGLKPYSAPEMITSGDIDNDGDVDFLGALLLIPADSVNQLLVHLNHPGINGKPAFDSILKSPFGLPTTHGNSQLLFPDLVDIDGDGDLDMFVFNGNSQNLVVQYYQNQLCQVTTQDLTLSLCQGQSLEYNGVIYNEEGDHVVHLQSQSGCDSIINLSIHLLPVTETSIEITICDGSAYQIGNESFNDPGMYTVHLTSVNGCDSIIQLNLNVDPPLVTSVEATICEGDVYQVGNLTFDAPGDYLVTLSTAQGCDSLVHLTLQVDVIDPAVITIDHSLIANQDGATYQWYNCDTGEDIPGAVGQEYEVTVTGNYAVHITDAAGCTDESVCTNVIISSLQDEPYKDRIIVYPNPARDFVYIIHKLNHPVSSVTIYSVSGQALGVFIPDVNHSIDLNGVAAGVYFLKIDGDGVGGYERLVVVK